MGRELRRVPANYQHPEVIRRNGHRGPQPMHNSDFATAAAEWKSELAAWESGQRPDYCDEDSRCLEFWEWAGDPPQREFYRTWTDEQATWFQVWETVSEGTPVTPPFATREELVEYLVANGDFWDQKRRKEGFSVMSCDQWDRAVAEAFVFGEGWAPSAVVDANGVRFGANALKR